MAPLLADAAQTTYDVPKVDVVFQDVAQRDQVGIFLKNLSYLKKGGFGLLAVKARSIDVTKKPKRVFNEVREILEKNVTVVDYRDLTPYEKDHALFVVKI
jgi:fibrillarin-like pre-rRNA processing protein